MLCLMIRHACKMIEIELDLTAIEGYSNLGRNSPRLTESICVHFIARKARFRAQWSYLRISLRLTLLVDLIFLYFDFKCVNGLKF